MIEFLRIEQRAGNLVAVFDYGYNMIDPLTFTNTRTFCLNEESLQARIANVERYGRNSSVERAALTELIRQKGEQQ